MRKDEKKASELLGLKQGTACPAPLNVANVSPLYSWNHPLTCPQKQMKHRLEDGKGKLVLCMVHNQYRDTDTLQYVYGDK